MYHAKTLMQHYNLQFYLMYLGMCSKLRFSSYRAALIVSLLMRDAFVRLIVKTYRRAIAIMFVCLSVRLGRACIVIIRCTLGFKTDTYNNLSLRLDSPMFWTS